MRLTFIFTLIIILLILIYLIWVRWLFKPAAQNFNNKLRDEQINSITQGPPYSDDVPTVNLPVETIINSLNKYDDEKCTPCVVKVNGDMAHNSTILTPYNELVYMQPNSNGEMVVPYGAWVSIRCGDAFAKQFDGQTLSAQCVGGKNFRINDNVLKYENLNCNSISMPTPIRSGLPCSGGTELITFGITFNDGVLPTMNACFNAIEQKTTYVEHTISAATIHRKSDVQRTKFIAGDFFNDIKVDELYKQKTQIKTLSRILGKDASNYITTKNFLTRGHLVAKADQIFSGQQRATFHFTNTAPQWLSFNNGNWSRIEDGVREFANKNDTTLLCWTGTWGICTLPDINGEQQDLYLNIDEQNNHSIAVPKLFYRIVIDAQSRKGIALVGVNNPYLKIENVHSDVIADDISDQITWINWQRENIEKGYCYASTVSNFTAVVKDLPLEKLYTTGILGLKELSS